MPGLLACTCAALALTQVCSAQQRRAEDELLAAQDNTIDVLQAALLISKGADPKVDIEACTKQVDTMAEAVFAVDSPRKVIMPATPLALGSGADSGMDRVTSRTCRTSIPRRNPPTRNTTSISGLC